MRTRQAARLALAVVCAILIPSCSDDSNGPNGPEQDTTPPTVAITYPTEGDTLFGNITITATATDDKGVEKVAFLVDSLAVGEDTLAPYEQVWVVERGEEDAAHALLAEATDKAGNVGLADTVTVIVARAPPDTIAPTVAITYPTDGETFSGNAAITIAVAAGDHEGVEAVTFLVDGEVIGEDSIYPYEKDWTVPPWIEGSSHVLQATATDAAGNEATSDAVTIEVAKPAQLLLSEVLAAAGPGEHNDHSFERLVHLDPEILYREPDGIVIDTDVCIRGHGAIIDFEESGSILVNLGEGDHETRFDIDHCIIINGDGARGRGYGGALEYRGIPMIGYTKGWVVNNTFYANSLAALYLNVSQIGYLHVVNNIFYQNADAGVVRREDDLTPDIRYNNSTGHNLANFGDHCACPHSASANPLELTDEEGLSTNYSLRPGFVQVPPPKPNMELDFHLTQDSECRNKGENGEDLGALPFEP